MPRRKNKDQNTVLDQTMHEHYDREAIAMTTNHEQSQTATSALISNDDHEFDNAMDDDYVPPTSPPLSQSERREKMRQLRLDHLELRDDGQSQTEPGTLLVDDDVNIDEAMDGDYVPSASALLSHSERLERMRQLRLDHLKLRDDEEAQIHEQAMLEVKAARRQRKREKRLAKQAEAMMQQQDGSTPNAENVDATKDQPPRRRRMKTRRRMENLVQQEALRAKGELRAASAGPSSLPISHMTDTSMDLQVLHGMQQLSVLPASEAPELDSTRMKPQQDTEAKPRYARSPKNPRPTPEQQVEGHAMSILSRMQKNVAKLIAEGLSSEEAQQAAILGEHTRLEKQVSNREQKLAKVTNPRERQALHDRHTRFRENVQNALRMLLEPGFLTPEQAGVFHQHVESKVLEVTEKQLRKARATLARGGNVKSRIGLLRRNLENTRNTFGTQSDQYLNMKFMVEETIKELEAKLAMELTLPQPGHSQYGSAPPQTGFEQQQSHTILPAAANLYRDIANKQLDGLPQSGQGLPVNEDDSDDHDDYDNDNDNGGVALNMSAGDYSGTCGASDGTVSAAQARAEDENHLQALRSLLSEISLQT